MAKHHTKNTVSTSKWCNRCKKFSQHAVSDRREAHCIECQDRNSGASVEHAPSKTVLIDRPCECGRYPFAHIHVETKPIR